MKPVFTCLAAFCLLRATALGCGGWDEEEPATLDETLTNLPAKSLGQIYFETSPKSVGAPAPDYNAEIQKIAARIGKGKPEDLAKEIDALLEKARQNYVDGDWCNLLNDVRDVVSASSQDAAAARDYIQWRLAHKEWFGFHPKPADGDRDVDPPENKPDELPARQAELERLKNTASGQIKAHWLYLRGALLFASGDRRACKEWFATVVHDFPDHPRAEFAQFMIARCDLSASRNLDDSTPEETVRSARNTAADEFVAFRKKYPGSRLDLDALGWLGGIQYQNGDSLAALQSFITQAEDTTHPEVRKAAVFMCESTLADLPSDVDNSAVYALLARHPSVAMAYIYQVLNLGKARPDAASDPATESTSIKKWRTTVLPLMAAEVAKQHDLYKADDWQPRYLAMLAQAASDAGDTTKALQITEVAADQLNRSDDLLFARGLALQRAKRPREAIEVYRELVKRFPDGPLTQGVRLRLALALQDNHKAGGAMLELHELRAADSIASQESSAGSLYPSSYADLKPTDSGIDPNISGVDVDQIDQAIDTLLNFAPVPELATALDGDGLNDAAKSELRAVLAERCLVAENFADAKKYMTPAQYGLLAANLEKLTHDADSAHDARERAEKFVKLGDAWAQARGKLLLLPLGEFHGTTAIYGAKDAYYAMPGEPQQRKNGNALGYPNVDTELEDRDELRHASRWWMRAARENPGTPLAASARWKALEAMPAIASASLYAETRAREIHFDQVSREIYNKLRSESPDSVEAKRYAAYWSIPAPIEDDQANLIYDENAGPYATGSPDRDLNNLGYEFSDDGAFGIDVHISKWESENDNIWQEISTRIGKLPDRAKSWDVARMSKELDFLKEMARDKCTSIEQLTCVNFLDDMALFAREKAVTPKLLQAYLGIRLGILGRSNWPGSPMSPNGGESDDGTDSERDPKSGIAPRDGDMLKRIEEALKDPDMKPVADYLECARIGMIASEQINVKTAEVDYKSDTQDEGSDTAADNHYTYTSRDFALMEKLCREFLKKYPASHKREAVAFVLARSVVSLSMPRIVYIDTLKPGTIPKDESFIQTQKAMRAEPFVAKRVLDVLDSYDREFPKGRYADDIRGYRAYVAWQTHDWGRALDLTLPQLNDNADSLLQSDAALRLANIFALLAQTDHRPDLMDAIRKRPEAQKRLRQFLGAADKDLSHPLRYMQGYLMDQFPAGGK